MSNTKIEPTFISAGFSNWKKALEKFKSHEISACHKEAMLRVVNAPKSGDIGEILNVQHSLEKENNRKNFLKILTNVQYLAKQNLAFRKGNNEQDSNFIQLLKLRSEDDQELSKWLDKNRNKYTSHENQNEILKLMANQVLTEISNLLRNSDFYAIMVDETPDLSSKEQAVICFRSVNDKLEVSEDFYGLYQVDSTKSDDMFQMVQDVLLRLNLQISKCRGQCYDGARNMSGCLNGLATQIQRLEKRALYIHCYGHSLNLGCADAIKEIPLLRNTLDYAHEITHFIKASPKRFAIFNRLKQEISDENIGIRVLCNTRWTVRADSLESILNNYGILIDTFEECLEDATDSKVRATIGGIISNMKTFESYLGFQLAKNLLSKCDILSKALQNPKLSAAQGQNMAKNTIEALRAMNCDLKFEEFWEHVSRESSEHEIDEPFLPRQRKRPKRFQSDNQNTSAPKTPKEHFKKIYHDSFEKLVKFIEERFTQVGFETYKHLENLILNVAQSKDFSEDFEFVTQFYESDFDKSRLKSELEMFQAAFSSQSMLQEPTFKDILEYFTSENPDLLILLSEVRKLMKLILVMPATNATSERSFSALRRVKSYLRTQMGQERLNNSMVLHVHKDFTEKIDLKKVANEFVAGHEMRLQRFGKFT